MSAALGGMHACVAVHARTRRRAHALLMASLRARGRFAFQSAAWRAAKLHVHHLTTVRPNPATLAYFSSRRQRLILSL